MMETDERMKILILSNDVTNRMVLQTCLQPIVAICEAVDCATGYTWLQTERYDLIVLDAPTPDAIAPDTDWLHLLQADAQLRKIPVLACVEQSNEEAQMSAFTGGAREILTKPFHAGLVRARVSRLLYQAGTQQPTPEELEDGAARQTPQPVDEYDTKTGLPNRKGFCRLASQVLQAHPTVPYALARCDIDRFQVYNDRFGVTDGDHLLCIIGEFATELQTRFTDILFGHLEADHFVALIPIGAYDSAVYSEQFETRLRAYKPEFEFVVRFGVYLIRERKLDVGLMCDRALLALRSTKKHFSKRIAYYEESMRLSFLEEQEIISEMKQALVNGQFEMYLQPQVNCESGEVIGAEALVRWIHPRKGAIAPSSFVPVFERNGFIRQVDGFIWECACQQLRAWIDRGLTPVPISVNISRVDVCDTQLCAALEELIKRYSLPPTLLRLEITEKAYAETPDTLMKLIADLHAVGFVVEMDDFGSQDSSLNKLKEMPIDVLKLDLRFLSGEGDSTKGGIILSSIVRLAHWLSLSVIAEGVETSMQVDYLRSLGCLMMQGYHFARPMTIDKFEEYMAERSVGKLAHHVSAKLSAETWLWDASTLSALIFNTYVGGALLIECCEDHIEIIRANDQFFQLLGTTREIYQPYCLQMQERLTPASRQQFSMMLREAMENGVIVTVEVETLSSEPVLQSSVLRVMGRFLRQNGKDSLFYLSVLNVTEQRNAERKAEKQQAYLQTLYDTVPCGLMRFSLVDGVVHLLHSNDTAWQILGFSDRDAYHKYLDDCRNDASLMAEIANELQTEFHRVAATESTVCIPHIYHNPMTKTWCTLSVNMGRIVVDGVTCVQCAFIDPSAKD